MKASAVIKRPSEVKGVVGNPLSITANVSKLGGASVIVDPDLDPTSTNPVENKAITEAIETINGNVSSLGDALDTLSGVVDGKYDASNPNGYISGISGNDVKTALGYTPYNATNPNGYISGITGADVTSALGFTPYNATNPDGYVNATQAANAAPVQSVNGQTGTVNLSIPTRTSDLTNNSGFITAAGAPVQSVNGETGAVTVSVPTKVSQLTNDSGFVNASGAATASPVQSVNGQTGAVSLTIPVVPSNVSAFTNDAGYLTLSTLPIYNGGVS